MEKATEENAVTVDNMSIADPMVSALADAPLMDVREMVFTGVPAQKITIASKKDTAEGTMKRGTKVIIEWRL